MSLIPTTGLNPWADAFKTLWNKAHNDDGTQKDGTYTLASAANIGNTTITLSAAPAHSAGSYVYSIVDAWTTNAELATISSFAGNVGMVAPLTKNHSAGAVVIPVYEEILVDWFGAIRNGAATGNAAAINAAIATGLGVRFGEGTYAVDGPLTLPSAAANRGQIIRGTAGRTTLRWSTDLGAGVSAFTVQPDGIQPGRVIEGINFYGPLSSVTIGTDPACMDGPTFCRDIVVRDCASQFFRSGMIFSFPDHTIFENLLIQKCWYGIYFSYGGISGGDGYWKKIEITTCGRACIALGHSQSMTTIDILDSTMGRTPVMIYGEDGSNASEVLFRRCTFEYLGNAFYYREPGSSGGGGFSSQHFRHCYVTQNLSYADGSLPTTGLYYNGSSVTASPGAITGDALIPQFAAWTYGYVGCGPGDGSDADWNGYTGGFTHITDSRSTNTSYSWGTFGTHQAFRVTTEKGSTSSAWNGLGGIVATDSGIQVTRGDLLQMTVGGGHYRALTYQTAGVAALGVSYELAETGPTYPEVMMVYSGYVTINVDSGDSSITGPGQWLKPDAAHNGKVVKASSYSDGPIVAVSMAAASTNPTDCGSTKTVFARLV